VKSNFTRDFTHHRYNWNQSPQSFSASKRLKKESADLFTLSWLDKTKKVHLPPTNRAIEPKFLWRQGEKSEDRKEKNDWKREMPSSIFHIEIRVTNTVISWNNPIFSCCSLSTSSLLITINHLPQEKKRPKTSPSHRHHLTIIINENRAQLNQQVSERKNVCVSLFFEGLTGFHQELEREKYQKSSFHPYFLLREEEHSWGNKEREETENFRNRDDERWLCSYGFNLPKSYLVVVCEHTLNSSLPLPCVHRPRESLPIFFGKGKREQPQQLNTKKERDRLSV